MANCDDTPVVLEWKGCPFNDGRWHERLYERFLDWVDQIRYALADWIHP